MNVRFGSFDLSLMAFHAILAVPAHAQTTIRANVDDSGIQSSATYVTWMDRDALSPDGRFILFASHHMVSGAPRGIGIIRDLESGTNDVYNITYLGSVSKGWGNSASTTSSGGNIVAFASPADDLVPGDGNLATDVFIRDRVNGTTERISVDPAGSEVSGESSEARISANGKRVAFVSWANGLVAGDNDGWMDFFLRDLPSAVTMQVNVSSSGALPTYPPNMYCIQCSPFHGVSLSADGRYVAFATWADNFVPGDTNNVPDIFVRDTLAGTTTCASVSPTGIPGKNMSAWPSISADGRFVAFHSWASDLVPGDTNNTVDVFVRDMWSNVTVLASVSSSGTQADHGSVMPLISGDGRVVAFTSLATNLVAGDTNERVDVFAHSLVTGATWRVSLDSAGGEIAAGGGYPGDSLLLGIDGNGEAVAFWNEAADIVPGDTNAGGDIFLRYSHSACAPIKGYCSGKTNSGGCKPAIGSTGLPSASGASSFRITVTEVLEGGVGVLLLGTAATSKPFSGGTLCVASPVLRLPSQESSAYLTKSQCKGFYSYEIAPALMAAKGLHAGLTLFAQLLSRDPGSMTGTVSLTAGLEFSICP